MSRTKIQTFLNITRKIKERKHSKIARQYDSKVHMEKQTNKNK